MAEVTDITSIPLYQIIGAPLMAMVQAEIQSSKATAAFIEQVGFYSRDESTDSDNHHYGDLKTVTFRYSKMGVGGKESNFLVEIPVLSIIPIPAIQIRDAQVEFAVEVNDAVQLDSKTRVSTPEVPGQDSSIEPNIVVFKAGMARSDSKTAMKVRINIEQADVPVGLQALFRVMEQGISSRSTPATAPELA